MSKGVQSKVFSANISAFSKSSFTLTFAVELLDLDIWHDCNEGMIDLGPCAQGLKLHYQLYPGQSFDVDILIWPHVAKIWCGPHYGWVRTWQFLERRFITFSIHHIFPVRVEDLRSFTAIVVPTAGLASLGAIAKNDKNFEVYLPPLLFGQRRYFGAVVDKEESLSQYFVSLIWDAVKKYIPESYLDQTFDVPSPVKDIRHQDAILHEIQEAILNKKIEKDVELEPEPEIPKPIPKDRRESKMAKEKEKEKEKKKVSEPAKTKFELKLPGNTILAGVGRIVAFEKTGDCSPEIGEIIVLISSSYLPAQDDKPIIFVNIDTLTDVPMEDFKNLGIAKLYTRWILDNEIHDSEPQTLKTNKTEIKFNDHYALPVAPSNLSDVTATFLDNFFEIQLRGIRSPISLKVPKLFGYQKDDVSFGMINPKSSDSNNLDILIAVTKIDGRIFSKGFNKFIRGEYPLYPPGVTAMGLKRESFCTNDVNQIRIPLGPNLLVPQHVVLQAQMTLEVSLGLAGCKPRKLVKSFGRMFCQVQDTQSVMPILTQIIEINETCMQTDAKEDALTGFALDTGSVVILYVEGPIHGKILQLWEMAECFYPKIKPLFSTSARYSTRVYSELLFTSMPFNVMKMFVPIGVLLACPPVYARPALPLPTKSALLKIGRILSSKLQSPPCVNDMPTAAELRSFKLEMCVSSKPIHFPPAESLRQSSGNGAKRKSANINE